MTAIRLVTQSSRELAMAQPPRLLWVRERFQRVSAMYRFARPIRAIWTTWQICRATLNESA
jgi:hypothetical protein